MATLLKDNAIYQRLVSKGAYNFVSMIDKVYDFCDDVLKMIAKDFDNYTQHDIQHAIRVIEYMTEFVKDNMNEMSDL